jgi:pre-mRNA-splicing helicase BRR2
MARPVYSAICQHASGDSEPAIVFVPTRKHAKLAALDLLTFASADGKPNKFLACDADDIAPHLERITDPAVRHALGFGVALLHESLPAEERDVVERVFNSGAASVLVVTAPLAWGLAAACKLTGRSITTPAAPGARITP